MSTVRSWQIAPELLAQINQFLSILLPHEEQIRMLLIGADHFPNDAKDNFHVNFRDQIRKFIRQLQSVGIGIYSRTRKSVTFEHEKEYKKFAQRNTEPLRFKPKTDEIHVLKKLLNNLVRFNEYLD